MWTATEVKSLLDREISDKKNVKLSDIFCHHFNVKELGNVKKYQVCYTHIYKIARLHRPFKEKVQNLEGAY